jgi:hypothetical protein
MISNCLVVPALVHRATCYGHRGVMSRSRNVHMRSLLASFDSTIIFTFRVCAGVPASALVRPAASLGMSARGGR